MSQKRFIRIGILVSILICGLLVGCGPSADEQAATSVALTAAAATDTPIPSATPLPTDTPTPTPTPVPYDLSLIVTGEDDAPIVGAHVVLMKVDDETGTQITDEVGQAFWLDLPGETVSLSLSAQGYFPLEMTESVVRGLNQMTVALERDPHGLLPSQACGPGEKLLYIEDFQDGEAQGWPSIELRAQDWNIAPDPDSPGDSVLFKPAEFEGSAGLRDHIFDNAVWRLQFMPTGRPIFHFTWHWSGGYEVDGTTVEWSAYQLFFHPPGLRSFRTQPPISTITLRNIDRTMRSKAWHQLEISTYEGVLEIWIDGVRFLSYNDPKPLPEGGITFGAGMFEPIDPQSVVYYDDFVVCELTSPFAPMPTPES